MAERAKDQRKSEFEQLDTLIKKHEGYGRPLLEMLCLWR